MRNEFNALDFGKAFIETILFWFFTSGIIFLSYWSFEQTWIFVRTGNPIEIAFWLAISIQYGQNVVLFMAGVHKNKIWEINDRLLLRHRDLYLASWIILALIDAGTNVGQWRASNPEIASTINIVSITWTAICIGVIFVEELLIISFSASLYKTNDLLESMGFSRISIFDAFEKKNKIFGKQDSKAYYKDDFQRNENLSRPFENLEKRRIQERFQEINRNNGHNQKRGRGRPPKERSKEFQKNENLLTTIFDNEFKGE